MRTTALHTLAAWMDENVPAGAAHTLTATVNEQHGGIDFTIETEDGPAITGRVGRLSGKVEVTS